MGRTLSKDSEAKAGVTAEPLSLEWHEMIALLGTKAMPDPHPSQRGDKAHLGPHTHLLHCTGPTHTADGWTWMDREMHI